MTATYLIPAGLLSGDEARRAVAAGQAQWLAGGSHAFSHVTALSRQADGTGARLALDFASAARIYPEQLRSLSQRPEAWAGFAIAPP